MYKPLSYITIKNFKKFDLLKVDNLSRINLITGSNNVGKSSLIEVFLIVSENNDELIKNLHRTLCQRGVHIHPLNTKTKNPIFPEENYFEYLKNKKYDAIEFIWNGSKGNPISVSVNDYEISQLTKDDFEKRRPDNYNIGNPNRWIKICKNETLDEVQWMYLDDFKRNLKYGYWPLISLNPGYNSDINDYYKENIGIDETISNPKNVQPELFDQSYKQLNFEEKKLFIESLNLFINDIEDTTIKNYFGRDILSLKTKSFPDYVPITFWGDGFNMYVRYLLEIVKNKNGLLVIDEFGEGVHWTKLKELWKVVIKSCQYNNVQLFCTTHSQDCIEKIIEACDESEEYQNDIRLIELEDAKLSTSQQNVYATTYDYHQIKAGINSGINLRGGTI